MRGGLSHWGTSERARKERVSRAASTCAMSWVPLGPGIGLRLASGCVDVFRGNRFNRAFLGVKGIFRCYCRKEAAGKVSRRLLFRAVLHCTVSVIPWYKNSRTTSHALTLERRIWSSVTRLFHPNLSEEPAVPTKRKIAFGAFPAAFRCNYRGR